MGRQGYRKGHTRSSGPRAPVYATIDAQGPGILCASTETSSWTSTRCIEFWVKSRRGNHQAATASPFTIQCWLACHDCPGFRRKTQAQSASEAASTPE
jgi:hypothetical protein